MRQLLKTITVVLTFICCTLQLSAQSFENTYSLVPGADHSFWKLMAINPFGYSLAGNKFFEPNNNVVAINKFDEFGTQVWSRSHTTPFVLNTLWKSYLKSPDSYGYVVVSSGNSGGTKAYHLVLNSNGMKLSDWVSPLPNGTQFGGLGLATNGGTIAVGSDGSGNMVAVKFSTIGEVQWTKSYPVSGFAWTVAQAVGGGYILAGTRQVIRIDNDGNLDWNIQLNLPISPDGSAYTYTEFEEITPLPEGTSFALTGSAFSNSTSAVYTARITYAGSVMWSKIHDPQNTALAGTPVAWTNNAIVDSYGTEIVTSWRRGPVSTGGTLMYQRMNFAGVLNGAVKSMANTIPVQEAFWTKAHGKYVVGGTRGGYSAAYSYVNASLAGAPVKSDDRSEPILEDSPLAAVPEYISNYRPGFKLPVTSRVFMSDMQVFPNPSNGSINVGGAIEPGALVRVLSPMGNVVLDRTVQPGETLMQLELNNVAPGMYTVEMIGKTARTAKKVVIQ